MDAIRNLASSIGQPKPADNKITPLEEQEPFKGNPLQSLQQMANQGLQKAKETYDVATSDVKKSFGALDDKLKTMLKQYTTQINTWARMQVQIQTLALLEKFRPIAKESIKDPDMCQCVKNLCDDAVDDVWPELMDEVKYSLMMVLNDPEITLEHKEHFFLFMPFTYFRNWYLYSNYPYDRTIWKQFKTISYWFWTIVSACPWYGVSQYFYVLDFICRDKQDEYQLVTFILSFKTMFFISQGVIKAIIGYFMLYACTTMDYKSSSYQADTCIRNGPGASIEAFSEVVGQFCQVFFIWFAFFLLPFSLQKGKPIFKYYDSPPVQEGCFERGGRIKYFMIYDFFALAASIGLFWLVYLIQYRPTFDNSGDFIYFTEICYGFLSFPFLLFSVPLLSGRLTKAKSTAYDRKGNCLPTSNVKITQKQKGEEKDQSLLASLTIDVSEVFDG